MQGHSRGLFVRWNELLVQLVLLGVGVDGFLLHVFILIVDLQSDGLLAYHARHLQVNSVLVVPPRFMF